jgi:hypothetical protein
MKKLFMLALVLTTLFTSAFSADPVNNNKAVVNAFNKSFSNATNVEWTINKEFHRAKFTVSGQVMYAYFTEDGELMAITRNIKVEQLPIALSSALSSKYKDYYLAELFELSSNGESTYYATVRNKNCSVTLQAYHSGTWKIFKKEKL